MSVDKYRDGYTKGLEEKAREEKDSGYAESLVKFPGRAVRDGLRDLFGNKDSNNGRKDARLGEPFDPSSHEE